MTISNRSGADFDADRAVSAPFQVIFRLIATLLIGSIIVLAPLMVQLECAFAQWTPSQQPGASMAMSAESLEDVQAKTIEIAKEPIPEKEQLLIRALDYVDSQVTNASFQRNYAAYWKDAPARYGSIIDLLKKSSTALAQFDCDANLSRYRDEAQTFARYYNDAIQYTSGLAFVDFGRINLPPTQQSNIETCKTTKAKLSSPEYAEAFKQVTEASQKALTDFLLGQSNLGSAYGKYLEALKQRRSALQDKLNSAQSAYQIGSNLWLLLLILATACVSTILGIKLFDPELQMEWVASGQVIQFVTVMILLSVILALGLSGVLKENTLGTLLGGVAGYVLAQGVGRAAARDVSRSKAGTGQIP
jgi:hypothetical protein